MVHRMFDEPQTPFNRELIQRLCLGAGRIMEETRPDLATILPRTPQLVVAHVDKLHQAAQSSMAIAEAARVLADKAG